MGSIVRYNAEPTISKFHHSKAFIRGITGPIGSGKSVGCCNELWRLMTTQQPDADGIRPTKFGVVRNTYAELKSTTILTWLQWHENITRMVYDAPIYGHVKALLPDGTRVESTLVFVSADRPKDVRKLKSLELTGIWFNEASEVDKSIFDMGVGRAGRYPEKKRVPLTRACIICDTNAADEDNWYHKLEENPDPETTLAIEAALKELGIPGPIFEFWTQPPALLERKEGDRYFYVSNPKAENITNQPLGFAYYHAQLIGKSRSWIRRFLMAQRVGTGNGRPVYSEFNPDRHVSAGVIKPVQGLGLMLGWDFALTPAVVVCQWLPRGRLIVLDEIVADAGSMGIIQFSKNVVKPFLARKYRDFAIESSVGDPSGSARDNHETRAIELLNDEAGIETRPALTNVFVTRREAVASLLTRDVDGMPGMYISKSCKHLIAGFEGKYFFERLQVSGPDAMFREAPKKLHPWADVHDSLQYVAMECVGEIKQAAQVQQVMRAEAAMLALRGPEHERANIDDAGY